MTVSLSMLAGAGTQFFDDNGDPLSGGLLYTYLAGTTSDATTFTTSAGHAGGDNANPIVLDAAGRVPYQIWLTDGVSYKFVVKTSGGVTVRTYDDIYGAQNSTLAASFGSSLVGFIHSGTGAVSRTAQSKMRDFVSIKDFGAVLDGSTDDSTALTNANAAAIAFNVPLLINGVAHIGSGTITAQLIDTGLQMFSSSSAVIINNGSYTRPEWWGESSVAIKRAVESLPSAGGVVKLKIKRYTSSYSGPFGSSSYLGNTWLDKANIKIQGEKMPDFSSDDSRLVDGSGTIISGVFNVFAENFEICDLGIDCGTYQRGILGLSVTQDGLVLAPPTQTLGYFRKKATVRNIVSLGVLANDFGHNMLFEGYQGGSVDNVTSRCAIHNIVIKSSKINASNLTASGAMADNYIIKSDSYGVQIGLNISNIFAKPYTSNTPVYGVIILGATSGGGNINLVNAEITSGATSGMRVEASANPVFSTNVSNVIVDGSANGIYCYGNSSLYFNNFTNIGIKNATTGIIEQGDCDFNNWSNLNFTNVSTCFYVEKNPNINNVYVTNCGTFLQYGNSTAKPQVGLFYSSGGITYDNLSTPAFLNSWANVGGGNPGLDVFMRDGKVHLSGLLVPGSSTLMCNIPANLRPPVPLYFSAAASNGAASVTVEAGGNVYVTTPAAATWVSLQNVSYNLV